MHLESHGLPDSETGMLTPDLAFWINNDYSQKPEPPCGIARQEVFRSFLKCSINPLQMNSELVSSNKPEKFLAMEACLVDFSKNCFHSVVIDTSFCSR